MLDCRSDALVEQFSYNQRCLDCSMKYEYGKQREAKKNVFTFDRFAKFVGGAACIFEGASIACRSDFCLEAEKRLKRYGHIDDCID
jgi:hypothetical protein